MDAKTLGNTPAFPCGADGGCGPWPGMTLRQWYAGLAAAAERVRRMEAGESGHTVYGAVYSTAGTQVDFAQWYLIDCVILARAYLAEHPADDDEPPSAAELDELFRDPLFPPVARDGKRFAFVQAYVEIQTRGQLRALVKGLGR